MDIYIGYYQAGLQYYRYSLVFYYIEEDDEDDDDEEDDDEEEEEDSLVGFYNVFVGFFFDYFSSVGN